MVERQPFWTYITAQSIGTIWKIRAAYGGAIFERLWNKFTFHQHSPLGASVLGIGGRMRSTKPFLCIGWLCRFFLIICLYISQFKSRAFCISKPRSMNASSWRCHNQSRHHSSGLVDVNMLKTVCGLEWRQSFQGIRVLQSGGTFSFVQSMCNYYVLKVSCQSIVKTCHLSRNCTGNERRIRTKSNHNKSRVAFYRTATFRSPGIRLGLKVRVGLGLR